MSGGSLSSRVKNMKFMQSASDKQRKDAKDAAKNEESKKLKDLSEWSLPIKSGTLKVIKSKSKKIRKVGYTTISSMGAVNNISSSSLSTDSVLGRKQMSAPEKIPEKNADVQTMHNLEHDNKDDFEGKTKNTEKSMKSKKGRKDKKSKKKSNIMNEFKSDEENDFDPTEVDLTSKSLLDLWKASKK
jgi:hypothetical protein